MNVLTRREAIRLGIAASMFRLLPDDKPRRRGVVFFPGIMGSTLTVKSNSGHSEIWSKDVFKPYRLLVESQSKLRFTGTPAEPSGIFDQAFLMSISIAHYYSKIIGLLN